MKGLSCRMGRAANACGILGFVLIVVAAAPACDAADGSGGSLSLTNDYMIRGISRSDHQATLQADLHYLNSSGLVAGAFVSSAHVTPGEGREAEVSVFVGFAWKPADEWQAKALASHYAYPGSGTKYDYDEVAVDTAYQQWLDLSLVYSPNYPRYVSYRGLIGVSSSSAEVNVQLPLRQRLSAIGGVGYSYLGGPDPAGYAYGSVGAAYDLAPWSLAVSFIETTSSAKALFYNEDAGSRWAATVIFRF